MVVVQRPRSRLYHLVSYAVGHSTTHPTNPPIQKTNAQAIQPSANAAYVFMSETLPMSRHWAAPGTVGRTGIVYPTARNGRSFGPDAPRCPSRHISHSKHCVSDQRHYGYGHGDKGDVLVVHDATKNPMAKNAAATISRAAKA
jgi:hypothetical protein